MLPESPTPPPLGHGDAPPACAPAASAPNAPDADAAARLRRHAVILAEFGAMAGEGGDPARLLQLATVQAGRGLGVAHAKVLRHRPAHGDLLIVAGIGWRPGTVGHVALGSDVGSAPGQAFQTGQPTVVDDIAASPDTRRSPVLRDHSIASVLNVPLVVDGAPWGVLEADSATPRRFDADEVRFLATLARILGLALHAPPAPRPPPRPARCSPGKPACSSCSTASATTSSSSCRC